MSTNIKPRVGTPVQYIGPFVPDEPEQPIAAVITKVYEATDVRDDEMYAVVNLVLFEDGVLVPGTVSRRTNITFRAPGQVGPSGDFCEFLEYA